MLQTALFIRFSLIGLCWTGPNCTSSVTQRTSLSISDQISGMHEMAVRYPSHCLALPICQQYTVRLYYISVRRFCFPVRFLPVAACSEQYFTVLLPASSGFRGNTRTPDHRTRSQMRVCAVQRPSLLILPKRLAQHDRMTSVSTKEGRSATAIRTSVLFGTKGSARKGYLRGNVYTVTDHLWR